MNAERVIAFRPEIARTLGSITAAIYFQQLYYWSSRGKSGDGWFYKTKDEIEAETTIPVRTQDRTRHILEGLEWLETKVSKIDGVPILHYRVLVNLETVVSFAAVPKSPNRPKWPNGTGQNGGNHEPAKMAESSLYTEITETTNIESAPAVREEKTAFNDEDEKLTLLLLQLIAQNNPGMNIKQPTARDFAAINKLHRLDHYEYQDIELIIRWCQHDSFWQSNILSTTKLRKQFNQLVAKAGAAVRSMQTKSRIQE